MSYKSKLNQQPLQVSCRPVVVRDRRHDQTNWLPALGFAFLTYNSFIAVYRSVGDPRTVAFVVVSYLDLLLLFLCLRRLDHTPEEEEEDGGSASSSRGKLKAAVWALASLLTLMFSYRVAEIMPWPAAVAIWAMAAVTVCGGFWGFFIYQYQLQDHADVDGVIAKP